MVCGVKAMSVLWHGGSFISHLPLIRLCLWSLLSTNQCYIGNDRSYPEEEGNLFTAVVEIVVSKFALLFSQI